MGVYDLWRKKKLEELDKTKRLSILNELDVGYRRMQHAIHVFLLCGCSGIVLVLATMGGCIATNNNSWWPILKAILGYVLLYSMGLFFSHSVKSKVEAEMQKELGED